MIQINLADCLSRSWCFGRGFSEPVFRVSRLREKVRRMHLKVSCEDEVRATFSERKGNHHVCFDVNKT